MIKFLRADLSASGRFLSWAAWLELLSVWRGGGHRPVVCPRGDRGPTTVQVSDHIERTAQSSRSEPPWTRRAFRPRRSLLGRERPRRRFHSCCRRRGFFKSTRTQRDNATVAHVSCLPLLSCRLVALPQCLAVRLYCCPLEAAPTTNCSHA